MKKLEKKSNVYTVVITDPSFTPPPHQMDSKGRYVRKFSSYGSAYLAMDQDFSGLLEWYKMDGRDISIIKDCDNEKIVLIDGTKISMKILVKKA